MISREMSTKEFKDFLTFKLKGGLNQITFLFRFCFVLFSSMVLRILVLFGIDCF